MNKIITYEALRRFAYSNDKICRKPIRGTVIFFRGLGQNSMIDEDPKIALRYGEQGILYLVPYCNPWCWMNREAVEYTEEILEVLFGRYGMDGTLPILATGDSMGGLSALIYTAKAKRTPKACIANCPVCDLVYHATEREDLPRTLYSAFHGEACDFEEALAANSPLHLARKGEMPAADYHIFHCTEDKAVNMEMHTERFVAEMKKTRKITCYPVFDAGHCALSDTAREKFYSLAEEYLLNKGKPNP